MREDHGQATGEPVRHVAVGPDRFAYVDAGEGPPVLFLHGALGDLRTWRRQRAALATRFRCLAYTQRYFGADPWRPSGPPFGTRTHAADLAAFCEALALAPVALVAWSYAGHIALQAALTRPDLFARVLVYEPGVPSYVTDPDELAAFARDAQAMFAPVFEAAGRGDAELAARRLIDASGGGAGYFDRQSAERRAIQLENARTMPLLLAQEPPPPIGPDDLAALAEPVSVWWGERSRPVFTIPSRAAARRVPAGAHAEVPGAGHLWPDEDPLGFAAAVGAWLDRGGP